MTDLTLWGHIEACRNGQAYFFKDWLIDLAQCLGLPSCAILPHYSPAPPLSIYIAEDQLSVPIAPARTLISIALLQRLTIPVPPARALISIPQSTAFNSSVSIELYSSNLGAWYTPEDQRLIQVPPARTLISIFRTYRSRTIWSDGLHHVPGTVRVASYHFVCIFWRSCRDEGSCRGDGGAFIRNRKQSGNWEFDVDLDFHN